MSSSLRSPLSLLALTLALTVLACTPIRRGGSGGGGSSDDDDSGSGDNATDDDDDTGDDDDATGDDDDDDGDDDDATGCANILSVNPESGEVDVYGDTASVTWDAIPNGGEVDVAGPSGSPVGGSISVDDNGRTLVFTANEPFAPNTMYTVTIAQDCTDDVQYSFSTGPYGQPVSPPSVLIGRTYAMDLASATFTQPPGVGALLQGFLVDVDWLIQPTSASDLPNGDMHVMGGMGELDGGDIVQDLCSETNYFTAGPDQQVGTGDDIPATWSNPWMELEADELSMTLQGIETVIQDALITAVFASDGEDWVGGVLEGQIDTRSLVGLVDSEDPNSVCDLVQSTVGVSCVDCGGGEVYCLDMVAEDVEGNWLSNISGGLVPRDASDVAGDPACN